MAGSRMRQAEASACEQDCLDRFADGKVNGAGSRAAGGADWLAESFPASQGWAAYMSLLAHAMRCLWLPAYHRLHIQEDVCCPP